MINKIVMERPNIQELEVIKDYLNNPEYTKYTIHRRKKTTMKDMIEYTSKQKHHYIFRLHTKLIGVVTINIKSDVDRLADISILVFRRNKGHGTEIIKMVKDFCFNCLSLDRLEAGFVKENIPCKKIFQKNGFFFEGIRRKAFWSEGEYKDIEIVGLTRDDLKGEQKNV